jgi:MFS family permease
MADCLAFGMTTTDPGRVHPRAAFQHRDFRIFQLAKFLLMIGWQMQLVAVGWQVYAITNRPLDLGLVGLAQFLPALLFTLPGGHAADRYDRRRVMMLCQLVVAVCALRLFFLARADTGDVAQIYIVLFALGTVRAFSGPASQALMPALVPAEHFPNAVAWNSSIWQFAAILGPVLGGFVYAHAGGAAAVYAVDAALSIAGFALMAMLRPRPVAREDGAASWDTVLAGVRYIFSQKAVLGAISMDLFAVLLGGAVALLPVYARDILKCGETGLGLLRAAPGVGAAVCAVAVAHMPPMRRAGAAMLWCVAGFGVATIVFGLSSNFWVSLAALTALGAFDMVSVVVRHTLVQLLTPPEMRGRVSAVNLVFIGASNELGEFESGITAQWFGTVRAVLIGGIGTLVVVALWAWKFPELRRFGRLDRHQEPPGADGGGGARGDDV